MIIRKRRSFYDVKKVETSKKVKKCPKGCVPAPKKKKKKVVKDPKKGTSFDPKLTSK
jgi:hypothetical protein